MKKSILFLIVVLLSIVLNGCDRENMTVTTMSYELDGFIVNDYSDANMIILEDSVSSTGLSLEFRYYGDDEGAYGSWYTIFVYENDEWNELAYVVEGDVNWNLMAYIVEKNKTKEEQVQWEWLYGELPSGKYLIVKEFANHIGDGENDKYYLACDFTIQ